MKHIDTAYHFVRHRQEEKEIEEKARKSVAIGLLLNEIITKHNAEMAFPASTIHLADKIEVQNA